MPTATEDLWLNEQVQHAEINQLEDCAIAIDASYYLQLFLDTPPFTEPLLPALGGLTGIQTHIEADLDRWSENKTIPFFIFDGQSVVGQDDAFVQRAKAAIAGTDEAWSLYFQSQANEAVSTFGAHRGAYHISNLFPMLQSILQKRGLHFLVPPMNASAQITYFDMTESEQCAAVMGPQELLVYPIKDYVIRYIDWDAGKFTALSKKNVIKTLGVTESTFTDALLMTGTSFLPTFPPLREASITPRPKSTVQDAVNMLRTSDKTVANACASFDDVLRNKDPDWLQKYRKARMAIEHFIYIADDGEVQVHGYDTLTNDNWKYLGYHLPAELLHYLNTGLISSRTLTWITWGQITVFPPLDGVQSEEYRQLVTSKLMPLRETTLGVILPRLTRGIQYKPIEVKVWYDDKYSHKIEFRSSDNTALQKAHTWDAKEAAIKEFFPAAKPGSLLFALTSLKNEKFAEKTVIKGRAKYVNSADMICTIVLWRFLHLRGYVNDQHRLTPWGSALATTLEHLQPTIEKNTGVTGLFDAALLAFELIRFDLLNTRNQHPELNGLPMNGSDDDKASLLLISRCAILLKLRHQANGYTGPLSKNFLNFRSLSSAIREADRDLIEGIIASNFLFAQSERDRDDYLEINQRLPFVSDSDVALGIAVKTLLDDIGAKDTAEQKEAKKADFPGKFVPFATHFFEDLQIAFEFFDALHAGVRTAPDVSAADKATWDKASEYLKTRR